MPEETFLVRLDPTTKLSDEAAEDKESRLRTLAGADGQVYGRASIWPDRYSSFFDPSGGWITIAGLRANRMRSEEHTSELQSLMRISYAVFCLKKKKKQTNIRLKHIREKHTTHRTNNSTASDIN